MTVKLSEENYKIYKELKELVTPEKVLIYSGVHITQDSEVICPKCKRTLVTFPKGIKPIKNGMNNCYLCGKKLDWSDSNE